ncbi:MAG: hypothetical protein ACLFNZ_11700, partial [Spirochaetaceae bacterium]
MCVSLSRITITASISLLLLITACTGVPENNNSAESSNASSHASSNAKGQTRVDDTSRISQEKKEAEKTAEEQQTVKNGTVEGVLKGLSEDEIFRIARDTIPDRFLFIEKEGKPGEGGRPVVIFHDLNNNGYRDALFLLVEKDPSLVKGIPDKLVPEEEEEEEEESENDSSESDYEDSDSGGADEEASGQEASDEEASGQEASDEEASSQEASDESSPADPYTRLLEKWYSRGLVPREALTSITRLYSDNTKPLNYFLSVFLQREDELISMYRIPLGAWKVLENYESVKIVESESMPLCISSSFETEDGSEKNWVIFSRYNKFSTFTLKNTLHSYAELRDLDSNGKLDIVKWNRVFEEGTGYETFLSWYRWNGDEYVQKDSINVVRNVNRFLAKAGKLLQAGLWEEAFIHMMGEPAYNKYRSRDYSFSELFSLLFKRVRSPDDQEEMPPEEELPQGVENFADTLEEENAADAGDLKFDKETKTPEGASTAEDSEEEPEGPVKDAAELIERDGSKKTFRLILFPKIMENPFRRYIEAEEGPPYRV